MELSQTQEAVTAANSGRPAPCVNVSDACMVSKELSNHSYVAKALVRKTPAT